jgi:hypothetical protein
MAQGEPVSERFCSLIRELYEVADFYRLKTYEMIQEIHQFVEPRGQLSLEVIFALYHMVFERIDIENGNFTSKELNPTWQEIKERVGQVIERFERE